MLVDELVMHLYAWLVASRAHALLGADAHACCGSQALFKQFAEDLEQQLSTPIPPEALRLPTSHCLTHAHRTSARRRAHPTPPPPNAKNAAPPRPRLTHHPPYARGAVVLVVA